MKLVFLALTTAIGVSAVAVDKTQEPAEHTDAIARDLPAGEPADCADRIERVRNELAQPKLERQPASPERPYLIAAVDKRVDGCAVMQMKGNVNDLRPLPEPPGSAPRLQPAR